MKNIFRLHCVILTLVALLTCQYLAAQEKALRDPRDIQLDGKSLSDFLKIHKNGLLEALAGMETEIDSEAVAIQLDYFLKQEGYSIYFLREADLSNADLSKSDLRFLDLKEAILTGCSLEKSDLSWANLKEADLTGANLNGSRIQYSDLKEANLSGASLNKAVLTGANLKEANVKGADFSGADLTGAELSEAENLTPAQLLGAKSLYTAKLPDQVRKEVGEKNPKLFK